jgi:hypothetical protein
MLDGCWIANEQLLLFPSPTRTVCVGMFIAWPSSFRDITAPSSSCSLVVRMWGPAVVRPSYHLPLPAYIFPRLWFEKRSMPDRRMWNQVHVSAELDNATAIKHGEVAVSRSINVSRKGADFFDWKESHGL